MWEYHYLFSNINLSSASTLRISILFFNNFFQIRPYLATNNTIISRMNISMSKNTGSLDITEVL